MQLHNLRLYHVKTMGRLRRLSDAERLQNKHERNKKYYLQSKLPLSERRMENKKLREHAAAYMKKIKHQQCVAARKKWNRERMAKRRQCIFEQTDLEKKRKELFERYYYYNFLY